MTRAAGTLGICFAGIAGELALLATIVPEADMFAAAGAAFVAFLAGPFAFLSVVAWRRRAHARRSRWLFQLAVVLAGLGIAAFAVHRAVDPEMRKNPLLNPAVVPLVQWVFVLYAWMRLNAFEKIEKRRR